MRIEEWARELRAEPPEMMDNAWRQPAVVIAYCRMLHTLATGRVGSKREAGAWALDALGPTWAPLIRRALDDRPGPWRRVHERSEHGLVEQTWRFVDHVIDVAQGFVPPEDDTLPP